MFRNLVPLPRRFLSSLSFKLSFYAGLIMLLAILAFSYHNISAQEQDLVRKMIRGATRDSEVITSAIRNGMLVRRKEIISEIIGTIARQDGFKEINIFDSKGVLRYSTGEARPAADATASRTLFVDPATNGSVRHTVSADGTTAEVVSPVLNTAGCSASGCHASPARERILGALQVKLDLTEGKEKIAGSTKSTLIFAVLLFLLISTISGLAVIFLVNPWIRRLRENAAKLANGEYIPDGPAPGLGEMAQLSRAFDIMSRRINERTEELEASRRKYKELFDEVPCYLSVVDRDYRIVRANRAFTVEVGELIGKKCFAGYKGLTARCENCPVEDTFADGKSHQSEEVWTIGGRTAHVIVKTSPIFNGQGKVAEVLEMSVNVTRLKSLQMELERRHEEYRRLFENVPCYLTVVDRDFKIVQANNQFERDFGAHIGKKCYSVYKACDAKCDNCPVEKTFADGQTHRSEEIWRRNGEPSHILVHTAPVTEEKGEIVAVMEMSTNVTEIKKLQGELVILGETIAGMSHSIKNILSGLHGGLYVVDSGLERRKEDRVRTGWAMVKRNVEKISDLVKGILYASKERTPDYKECKPGDLVAELCDLYEHKALAEGIQLVRMFDSDLTMCVLDPAGVHTALSNLISNAIEACRDSQKSGLRTITVQARVHGTRLLLSVIDDADGIPTEVKDRLFHKFYSTKGSKGTGLGLVITRKVIEEHGGTIGVESEPGNGTTFSIEIPLNGAPESAGPESETPTSKRTRLRVINSQEETMHGIGLCALFSRQGDWAFDYALQLARKHKTRLNIFHFLESPYVLRRDVVFVDAARSETAQVTPELVVEKDKELRDTFDERLGDYANVGFRLCEGASEWELKKCFKRGEYEVLVIGYEGKSHDFGGTTTIEEFAGKFHGPLVLVGPDAADEFYLNRQAKDRLKDLDIPDGKWHVIE